MMTSRDRAELLVAAVIGAVLGGVTGYLLSSLVESGGWLKILIGRSLVQSSSLAWFFVFGLFVRECFCPAASRDEPYPRVLWGLRCFSLTPPNGGGGRLVCRVLNAETIPRAICQTLLKGGVDAM